jgi:hypothetical protein
MLTTPTHLIVGVSHNLIMSVVSQHSSKVRSSSIGPVLSFSESLVSVIEGSFHVRVAGRSQSGYTLYNLQFKVRTDTPQGEPVIQECECLKRFSDFRYLAGQIDAIDTSHRLPSLIKANYFGEFLI